MFRLVLPLRKSLSSRLYHPTPVFSMPQPTFIPKDWTIIETSSGGQELDFYNTKTGESTWYTPDGMSAAEILAIPDAKKYWSTIKGVEKYMKKMADEKSRNGGKDIADAVAASDSESKA